MDTIQIDFDVFKALTAKRRSAEMTYNDVLREMLGLDKVKAQLSQGQVSYDKGGFVSKGVAFPEGTSFRATYKGKHYFSSAKKGGMLFEDGYVATSPSDAARYVTNTNVNGWRFWECRFPNARDWRPLEAVRVNLEDMFS